MEDGAARPLSAAPPLAKVAVSPVAAPPAERGFALAPGDDVAVRRGRRPAPSA